MTVKILKDGELVFEVSALLHKK